MVRSATRAWNAASRSVRSRTRKMADGWTVIRMVEPVSDLIRRPRSRVTWTSDPRTPCAAVAPISTVTSGWTSSSSSSSHGRHARTCRAFGRSWRRRLPSGEGRQRKCLTILVTKAVSRSIPAAWSARSRTRPAGPTNGRPARSSWSPGCSPTRMIRAGTGPSPMTAWVARSQSSHCRHASTSRLSDRSAFLAISLLSDLVSRAAAG